ncbi:MAG: alanyl-tRNA editing protein [Acidobacteriaceae bacterium]
MTERLYYADSFLTEFDAVVMEIQELSRANGRSLWRVALDRSAFYPTSGGQPHDTGRLIATARSGTELVAEILGVEEDESGQVWHHTAKPLLAETRVCGFVDGARRLDHVQQHSGQHLLSAAFIRVCGAPTVSFHLGDRTSTIDLAVDSLPDATLLEVEELANRVIAEDRPVTATTASRKQAEEWLANRELRKLPPRDGDLRIIDIADVDRNACGGTHVRSTGQIGGLHLRAVEKVRQGLRVEFVCGLRAMRAVREDFRSLTEAGRLLSAGLAEVPEAVEQLRSHAKQTARQIEALTLELAEHRAAKLVRETPLQDGLRIVRLRLGPPDYPSPAEGKLLASKLTAFAAHTITILAWQPPEKKDVATIIFARTSDLDFDCGALLQETLAQYDGRGGGSKSIAQGSIAQGHLLPAMDDLETAAKASR